MQPQSNCQQCSMIYPSAPTNTDAKWGTDGTVCACAQTALAGDLAVHAVQISCLAHIQHNILSKGIGMSGTFMSQAIALSSKVVLCCMLLQNTHTHTQLLARSLP